VAATHCNTLQHTTAHYTIHNSLQPLTFVHERWLQHTATHRIILQHTYQSSTYIWTWKVTAAHCNTPQHTAIHVPVSSHLHLYMKGYCNTPQHTTNTHTHTLQHAATHTPVSSHLHLYIKGDCNTLQHTATHIQSTATYICTWRLWANNTGWRRDTGSDALNYRSLSAKEPLIMGLFCGENPTKIRHPMHPRHPVPRLLL